MLQMFLAIIQLLATGLFTLVAIIFLIVALVRWRRKKRFYPFAGIALGAAALAFAIWSIDLFQAESQDRERNAEAFHDNFGFNPPSSVAVIKTKNIFIYDASGHWMSFTYDPIVFDRIVERDQPLQVAYAGTKEFSAIIKDAYLKNQNRPDWAQSPEGRTSQLLFKKDFLNHTSSEYYLWVDSAEGMVHLHVSYFD